MNVRGLKLRVFKAIALITLSLTLSGCTISPVQLTLAEKGPTEVSSSSQSKPKSESDVQNPKSPVAPVSESTSQSASQPPSDPAQEVAEPNSQPLPELAPQPAPPGTPVRPYYDGKGNPPTAPGLAMRTRVFAAEKPKIAYLTIDDGPSPDTTPHILRVLKEEGVKATFFVIGTQVETHPELIKAEYDQGHAIGNHTYSHNYSEIYRSPQALINNFKRNEDLIYNTIGIRPRIIRTPGGTQGHFNISYYNAVDSAGYLVYDWNVSTADASARLVPADQIVRNIQEQVPGRDKVIILMHDAPGKTTSVDALPRIIRYLKNQGYTFGVLSPEVAPILFPGGFKS
ncbi:MAG: polysaccharide deacetylase family protein [Desulfitobacterium hafniense]|nr:polysaccharide deacetylase family protein [Desulfitobacterium hafniense]